MELSSDQKLDPEVIRCGNEAIRDYWKPDMIGGLMFRPFLRWWDKSLVEILQSPFSEAEITSSTGEDDNEEEEGDNCEDDNYDVSDQRAEESQPSVKSKRGTEIRLVGLDISQTLGTAFWSTIKTVLSCSRCKNQQEIEVKEEKYVCLYNDMKTRSYFVDISPTSGCIPWCVDVAAMACV